MSSTFASNHEFKWHQHVKKSYLCDCIFVREIQIMNPISKLFQFTIDMDFRFKVIEIVSKAWEREQ